MRQRTPAQRNGILVLFASTTVGALYMLKIGWWWPALLQLVAIAVLGLVFAFQRPVDDPVGRELQKSVKRIEKGG